MLVVSAGLAGGGGCALIAGLEDGELAPPDGASSTGGGSPSGTGGEATSSSSSASGAGGAGSSGMGGSGMGGSGMGGSGMGGSGMGGAGGSGGSGMGGAGMGGAGMGGAGGSGGSVGPTPGMITIPEGPFMMGCNSGVDNLCDSDEKPYHQVTLSAYEIDITEVSRGDYKKCVDAGVCTEPPCDWDPVALANHPVTCVKWANAFDYCQWAGKRLPTEAEWEKASRADGGYKFPWKAEFNDDCSLVNANLCKVDTAPIDSHIPGASPYGALNMSGNAAEWVNDYYAAGYYALSPAQDPKGPANGTTRVHRGGSWNSPTTDFRCSSRSAGTEMTKTDEIGFRCAK
jgi:formylglycine-generating enzyme required for sulfatase activity